MIVSRMIQCAINAGTTWPENESADFPSKCNSHGICLPDFIWISLFFAIFFAATLYLGILTPVSRPVKVGRNQSMVDSALPASTAVNRRKGVSIKRSSNAFMWNLLSSSSQQLVAEPPLLLTIPIDILQDILDKWVTLHELIRLDSALSSLAIANPLIPMLPGKSFEWPGNAAVAVKFHPKLMKWLQSRGVFVDRISFHDLKHALPLEVKHLLKWSSSNVTSISIVGGDHNLWQLKLWITESCNRLRRLEIAECNVFDNIQGVLEHSVATLHTVILDDITTWSGKLYDGACVFPCMRVLHIHYSVQTVERTQDCSGLVRSCPNLTALSIQRTMVTPALIHSIEAHSGKLPRLQLVTLWGDSADLLQITHCYSDLRFLKLENCMDLPFNAFSQRATNFRNLHTLIIVELYTSTYVDDVIVALSTGALPQLRVLCLLGYRISIPFEQFRNITTACPHLTSLSMSNIHCGKEAPNGWHGFPEHYVHDAHTLYEFCGALEHLDIKSDDNAYVGLVLQSVALYCPNLRSENIGHCKRVQERLLAVVTNCTKLQTIVAYYNFDSSPLLAINPALQITNKDVPMTKWLSAE